MYRSHELLGELVVDAVSVSCKARVPDDVPDPVKSRFVVAVVFTGNRVDLRLDIADDLEQAPENVFSLAGAEVIVQPVIRDKRANPARGVPVNGLVRLADVPEMSPRSRGQ